MKDYVIDILQAIVPSEVANKIWKKIHSLTIYLQNGEKAVIKTNRLQTNGANEKLFFYSLLKRLL